MKIQPTVLAVTRQCWVPWLVLTKDTEHSRGPPWLVSADDSGESGTKGSVDPLEGYPRGTSTSRGSQRRSTVVFLSTTPDAVPVVSNGRLFTALGATMISKRNIHHN